MRPRALPWRAGGQLGAGSGVQQEGAEGGCTELQRESTAVPSPALGSQSPPLYGVKAWGCSPVSHGFAAHHAPCKFGRVIYVLGATVNLNALVYVFKQRWFMPRLPRERRGGNDQWLWGFRLPARIFHKGWEHFLASLGRQCQQ